MQPQSAPLPPDVLYIIDSALDNDDLNGFDHVVLSLFGDRKVVQEIVDKERPKGCGWRCSNGALCKELDLHAHEVAALLSEEDQQACFASSLLREPSRLISLAECLAGWNYNDSTVGGALKPFRKPALLTRDHKPTPKIARRLYAPSAIRWYVGHCDSESVEHPQVLASRLRNLPWPTGPGDASRLEEHFAEQRRRLVESRRRAAEQFFLNGSVRPSKRWKREERQSIKRAIKTSSNIVGSDVVLDFVRGKEVDLRGESLIFSLAGSIRGSGHSALTVTLKSSTGDVLGGLCLYFDRTPAVDQLTAIALHLLTDGEQDLLKTGNLYNVTLEGAEHPLIADRLKQSKIGHLMHEPFRDLQREQCSQYVREMTSMYLWPLTELVWKQDAKKIVAFATKINSTRFVRGPLRFQE